MIKATQATANTDTTRQVTEATRPRCPTVTPALNAGEIFFATATPRQGRCDGIMLQLAEPVVVKNPQGIHGHEPDAVYAVEYVKPTNPEIYLGQIGQPFDANFLIVSIGSIGRPNPPDDFPTVVVQPIVRCGTN